MPPDYDRDRVIDCMFDPVTSLILAEFEDGGKQCSYLATRASISEQDVLDKLSYLIESGFIIKNNNVSSDAGGSKDGTDGSVILTADLQKLSSIVEDGDNFDAAVDGLTKMDSYLN